MIAHFPTLKVLGPLTRDPRTLLGAHKKKRGALKLYASLQFK